jgi:hypothetical protein
MFGRVRFALASIAALLIFSSSAFAQASITGVVRDTSGAVLPGVTVEASSPALIEKVRSVVSDGSGQYRIENLRPGDYVVTFTLPGFATVKREGIQLAGSFVASVNAELRVGALEETITVTGETPSVDVQSTLRQTVFDEELLEALPSSRAPQRVAALLPGVTTQRQDVGGIQGDGTGRGLVTVRGVSDARMNINGVSNQATSQSVTAADGAYNMAAYQEMAVDTGGSGAEYSQGGLRMNMIPRDGGNVFRGYFLASYASDSLQSDNINDDLIARGLSAPDKIKRLWDINPAFGGPIKRDKVWFHSTMRLTGAATYASLFFNKNAGDPNAWAYEPDTSREAAFNDHTIRNANVRVTWQATQKHKLAVSVDPSRICDCPRGLVATTSPEAFMMNYVTNQPKVFLFGDWTAPLTNRLLLDSAFVRHWSFTQRPAENLLLGGAQNMIAVTEQSNNLLYRASFMAHKTQNDTLFWRGSASYITGAHSFKVGFNYGWGLQDRTDFSPDAPIQYRFNNLVPNQLTLHARPFRNITHIRDHGLFVQDRWTVSRLTVTGGLRYDYFHDFFPETPIGPSVYAPNRNFVFPKTDGVRWHDLQPRAGVAYDIFGDGRTALKASLNKYMAGQAAIGIFAFDMAPSNRLVNTTNRSWNDANRNYVPDCDLVNPVVNGECGAMSNPDFGTTRPGVTYDPDTLKGWGKRDNNWQFTTSLQREILPRTSVEVSYFRTWFGNFTVQDDRALTATDFNTFSIAAPADPRLPDGGNYTISGLYDRTAAAFGRRADLYLTFADNFGHQSDRYDGVDFTINARPRPGLLLTGGTNTQRRTTDKCEVVAQVPEAILNVTANAPSIPYCNTQGNFITQVKLTGSYTVPRVEVQVTAALQSQPGPEVAANFTATNAVVQPSLGRPLSGGTANIPVNLIEPGTMYGERMNQLDLRIAKIVNLVGVRWTASVDLYNALNTSPVITQSDAYASWLRPQAILNARFAKLVIQVDF